MSTFITADEHYGHANIIKFCKRPYANTDEMREDIIAKHNAKVGPNDHTIHLGDMFWHTLSTDECVSIVTRLNGSHGYIWGNHEEVFADHYLQGQFDYQLYLHEISHASRKIVLCHYAMRVWNGSHRGSWMLYGHSHNELPEQGLSFDIGVDGHNFEPWSLDEIAEKMKTLKNNHIIPADKVWPGKEL